MLQGGDPVLIHLPHRPEKSVGGIGPDSEVRHDDVGAGGSLDRAHAQLLAAKRALAHDLVRMCQVDSIFLCFGGPACLASEGHPVRALLIVHHPATPCALRCSRNPRGWKPKWRSTASRSVALSKLNSSRVGGGSGGREEERR